MELLRSWFAVCVGSAAARTPSFSWDTVPVFQHLASPNATASAPFSPARTAWLATFPLVVIEHAQGQGYMYTPNPGAASGEYGPVPYDPAEFGAKYLEDAAEDAAKAIRSYDVLLYEGDEQVGTK